jgi:hypothetical protein
MSVEDGRILCEAELLLEARALREETVTYSRDAYEIGRQSEVKTATYRLPHRLRCVNSNFTQSESRSLSELGLTPMGVLDVGGTAVLERVEVERGHYVVTGKCRYTLLMSDSEGEVVVRELELPLRYVLDGTAEDQPTSYEGQLQLLSVRARMDAERLAIDAELGIWLYLEGERAICAVSEVRVGEALSRTRGELRLCYPAPDDTPYESLRYCVFAELLSELRLFLLHESYYGREETLGLIEEHLGEVTFDRCATSARGHLALHEALASRIKASL